MLVDERRATDPVDDGHEALIEEARRRTRRRRRITAALVLAAVAIGAGLAATIGSPTGRRIMASTAPADCRTSTCGRSTATASSRSCRAAGCSCSTARPTWLIPHLGAHPVKVAAPLFVPTDWPSYYGQIAWNDQFSWSSE
jgi:hypothetical protein